MQSWVILGRPLASGICSVWVIGELGAAIFKVGLGLAGAIVEIVAFIWFNSSGGVISSVRFIWGICWVWVFCCSFGANFPFSFGVI